MNYFYTIRNTITNKEKQSFILNIKNKKNPTDTIYRLLLERKRESYFRTLFEGFEYELDNIEEVRNFLPDQYKIYANNLKLLKFKLISYRLITAKYEITEIKIAPKCLGCVYDAPGQRDHMIYPHGCLL
jgi:hypothetical protein